MNFSAHGIFFGEGLIVKDLKLCREAKKESTPHR
jgi:hypothetical protein